MRINKKREKCRCGKFGKPFAHEGYCSARAELGKKMIRSARTGTATTSQAVTKTHNLTAEEKPVSAIGKAHAILEQKELCKTCGQKRLSPTHDKSYNHRHCETCVICQNKVNAHIQTVGPYGESIKIRQCPLLKEGKQARKRAGANFDAAERAYLVAVGTADENELNKAINTIIALPNANRPNYFKNKTAAELHEFFANARKDLRDKLPNGCTLVSNDDNHKGKDLTDTHSGKQIELKSGPDKTDANNGVGLVAKITGLEGLKTILSPEERRGETDKKKIEASKRNAMRELGKKFLEISPEKKKDIFNYVCAVSYGCTKEEEILQFIEKANTSNNIEELNLPLQLMFTENGHLTEYKETFILGEDYAIVTISDDEGRSFLRIEGRDSGRVATIYPNYKNSWGKDEHRQEAGDWVSSPAFQVWIR